MTQSLLSLAAAAGLALTLTDCKSTGGVTARTQEKSPVGPPRGGSEGIMKTGGPPGSSLAPADVPSYTLQVLFENGQVARLSAVPNAL